MLGLGHAARAMEDSRAIARLVNMASEPTPSSRSPRGTSSTLNPKSPATQSRSAEGAPQQQLQLGYPYGPMDTAQFQAAGGVVDETCEPACAGPPQIPGFAGFKGCYRCGSKEHRQVNCRVKHGEQVKKPIRRAVRVHGEDKAWQWLKEVFEDVKIEEQHKRERKEKKKREKNEGRRVRRKERKFREGYADMREWQRQLERNAREGRARQMRDQRERKSQESKKKTEGRVRQEREVRTIDNHKTLTIIKDKDKTDRDKI
jgi:hypothetical protein